MPGSDSTSTFEQHQTGFVLPPEQEKVVNHRGGHLQVIACAGAGKTEAISRRVASLICEGVEPAQIISFTFTERAAESLKGRITRRVAEAKGQAYLDRLSPMFVGTIHAYCLRMLQDHIPEFGNHDILDENRLAGLLSREYKRLELSKLGVRHWRPIFDFLRNADVVENELVDAELIRGTPFGECYHAFTNALHRYHFLTYGLLISSAVKALARPEVANRVRKTLRFLIVDEYQDINPAQEKLIALLAPPPVELCVVADDDQSIYQWRGSDVSNMLEFRQRYSPTTTLTLSVNRRGRPKIITSANTFALSIVPRLEKKMEPHRPPGGPEVHGWAAETDEVEAVTIADTVDRLRGQCFRYKDIAILYRSVRTASPPLIEEFKKRNIPFRCAGRTGLFLQPEASALGKLYAFLSGNDWKNERYGESQSVDIEDVDNEFAAAFNKRETIPHLRPYLQDWQAIIKDNTAQVNLVRDFYRLLRLVGIQNLNLDDAADSARMGTLARFSQIMADFEHVTRRARYVDEQGQQVFRGGQDRGIYFYQRLYNYLQYYALDAYEDFQGEDTFDLDAVDILTVHQSKGLEWPVVFLPSLVVGRFPSRYAGQAQDWLLPESVFPREIRQRYEGSETEERRLFYVALTRAKDVVYLSRFHRKTNKFKPSPFLLEVADSDPPLSDALPLPPTFTPLWTRVKTCPRFRSQNWLPTRGVRCSTASVHRWGFSRNLCRNSATVGRSTTSCGTWLRSRRPSRSRPPPKTWTRFSPRSSTSRPPTTPRSNLLDRARSLVGKYLSDYSSELLRVWETERPFELHLDKGVVEGRADVILDREAGIDGKLGIVDYKTANDPKTDDVFAFQLAINAAAGLGEGFDLQAAYLHSLKEGVRKNVPVDDVTLEVARQHSHGPLFGSRNMIFSLCVDTLGDFCEPRGWQPRGSDESCLSSTAIETGQALSENSFALAFWIVSSIPARSLCVAVQPEKCVSFATTKA